MYLRRSTLPSGPIYTVPSVVKREDSENLDYDYEAETLKPYIEQAFAKKEFVHPTKPNLKVEKVYDVVPDLSVIHREYSIISFDEEPHDTNEEAYIKEFEDEEADHILALYAQRRKRSFEEMNEYDYKRNYKFMLNSEPGQNDVIMWLNEEEGKLYYAPVGERMMLKKKKVPKGITNPNTERLPSKSLVVRLRDPRKHELIERKEKLIEYEAALDPGLDSDTLDNMEEGEDIEEQEKKKKLVSLFGDEFSDEEES
jgi:hypothetical protein